MIRLSVVSIFSLCFDRKYGIPSSRGLLVRVGRSRLYLGHIFHAPSSWHGGKQSDQKVGGLDTQGAAEFTTTSEETTIWPKPHVCMFVAAA